MLREGETIFHFAEPHWLFAFMIVPMVWLMYAFFRPKAANGQRLEDFADAHLLPHICNDPRGRRNHASIYRSLAAWSLIWSLAVLSMAGPRWGYTDIEVYKPSTELVILLDLSRSMDVADVKPSRIARARQEIEDIIRYSRGVNVGLIAFANIPHTITPLTDDKQMIERLVPSINTGLVYTQGSRIVSALDTAGRMLSQDTETVERHILIVTDGGYDDPEGQVYRALRGLTDKGVHVHVMGVGTPQGGAVPDGKGGFFRQGGGVVMSSLQLGRLQGIAQYGHGVYLNASYLQDDTQRFLSEIGISGEHVDGDATIIRQWDEKFYLFLLPALLLPFLWFRRGVVFPLVFFCLLSVSSPTRADSLGDYFVTPEQKGRKALEDKDFEQAEEVFQNDSYRRGVVQYRAGDYEAAAQSFEKVERPEVSEDAAYNLGNARLMGGHIEDAISAYENVLQNNPDHQDAAHNLEIARKILEEKKQQNSGQNEEKGQDQKNQQQQQSQQNQQGLGENTQDQQEQSAQSEQRKQEGGAQQQQPHNSKQEDQEQKNAQSSEGSDEKGQEQQGQQGQGDQEKNSDQAGQQKQTQQAHNDSGSENQGGEERTSGQHSQNQPEETGSQSGAEKSDEASKQETEEDKVSENGHEKQTEPKSFPPQPENKTEDKSNSGSELAEQAVEDSDQGRNEETSSREGDSKNPQEQGEDQKSSAQARDAHAAEQQKAQKEQASSKKADNQDQKAPQESSQPPQPEPRNNQQNRDSQQVAQTEQSDAPEEVDTRPNLSSSPGTGPIRKRTPKDVDADQWLNRIESDTETFLKNKFYVESEMQGAREGAKPW